MSEKTRTDQPQVTNVPDVPEPYYKPYENPLAPQDPELTPLDRQPAKPQPAEAPKEPPKKAS